MSRRCDVTTEPAYAARSLDPNRGSAPAILDPLALLRSETTAPEARAPEADAGVFGPLR